VRVLARGEAMLAPSLTRRLERFARQPVPGCRPESLPSLSERERAVLKLVVVSRLLTKLDLRDQVQIAVLAYETGLVPVGDT
jgi:DNA-binding NarL/FixJ family response regulator